MAEVLATIKIHRFKHKYRPHSNCWTPLESSPRLPTALRPINGTLRHKNTDCFHLAIPKTPTPVSCTLPGKQEGFGAFLLQPQGRPVNAQPAQRCPHCTTFSGKPSTLFTTVSFQTETKPLTSSRLPSPFHMFQDRSSCAIPANPLLKSAGQRSHEPLMTSTPLLYYPHYHYNFKFYSYPDFFFFFHWHIKALENGLASFLQQLFWFWIMFNLTSPFHCTHHTLFQYFPVGQI